MPLGCVIGGGWRAAAGEYYIKALRCLLDAAVGERRLESTIYRLLDAHDKSINPLKHVRIGQPCAAAPRPEEIENLITVSAVSMVDRVASVVTRSVGRTLSAVSIVARTVSAAGVRQHKVGQYEYVV
eukprot:1195862-Prorocentrum_minimum.AAC.6